MGSRRNSIDLSKTTITLPTSAPRSRSNSISDLANDFSEKSAKLAEKRHTDTIQIVATAIVKVLEALIQK